MNLNPRLLENLERILLRHEELARLLADAAVLQSMEQFKAFSKEYATLEPVVAAYKAYTQAAFDLAEVERLRLEEAHDSELLALAEEERVQVKRVLEVQEEVLQELLLPSDPDDDKNLFLEIRAGTGGEEAALFAADLCRMYVRYAESKGWLVDLVTAQNSDQGGFKEVILKIEGPRAYAHLKSESGGHRVQRVPDTEAQGRVHTSACTVAVLPESVPEETVVLNPAELRIDTFRASGAGGQHVNRTDSAVRIVHLPTGITVECQQDRSQHKNKARAMSLLATKIQVAERAERLQSESEARRALIGSGDRSERIRTYNFPQGRVTDHRINLSLYQLLQILEGHLDPLIQPLLQAERAERLAALGNS